MLFDSVLTQKKIQIIRLPVKIKPHSVSVPLTVQNNSLKLLSLKGRDCAGNTQNSLDIEQMQCQQRLVSESNIQLLEGMNCRVDVNFQGLILNQRVFIYDKCGDQNEPEGILNLFSNANSFISNLKKQNNFINYRLIINLGERPELQIEERTDQNHIDRSKPFVHKKYSQEYFIDSQYVRFGQQVISDAKRTLKLFAVEKRILLDPMLASLLVQTLHKNNIKSCRFKLFKNTLFRLGCSDFNKLLVQLPSISIGLGKDLQINISEYISDDCIANRRGSANCQTLVYYDLVSYNIQIGISHFRGKVLVVDDVYRSIYIGTPL